MLQCVICHAQRPSSPALPPNAMASFPAAQAHVFSQAFPVRAWKNTALCGTSVIDDVCMCVCVNVCVCVE